MTGTIDPVAGTHMWNPYAVGQKRYGASGSSTATSGPVSAAGRAGYTARDRAKQMRAARLQAIARRYGAQYPGTTPTTGA